MCGACLLWWVCTNQLAPWLARMRRYNHMASMCMCTGVCLTCGACLLWCVCTNQLARWLAWISRYNHMAAMCMCTALSYVWCMSGLVGVHKPAGTWADGNALVHPHSSHMAPTRFPQRAEMCTLHLALMFGACLLLWVCSGQMAAQMCTPQLCGPHVGPDNPASTVCLIQRPADLVMLGMYWHCVHFSSVGPVSCAHEITHIWRGREGGSERQRQGECL